MSDISLGMFISPPWSHCVVRALFRTAIVRRFLAAFLPMSALAISSGKFFGSLHIAQLLRVTAVTSFQCLVTAVVHLYFASLPAKSQGTMRCTTIGTPRPLHAAGAAVSVLNIIFSLDLP